MKIPAKKSVDPKRRPTKHGKEPHLSRQRRVAAHTAAAVWAGAEFHPGAEGVGALLNTLTARP